MVLAWVSITTGYVVVRATQSLKGLSTGILIYGIWVLVVEVRPLPCPALHELCYMRQEMRACLICITSST